jgi:hypothetical protein
VHEARRPSGRLARGLPAGTESTACRVGSIARAPHRIRHPHVHSILGSRHCDEPYGGDPVGLAVAV